MVSLGISLRPVLYPSNRLADTSVSKQRDVSKVVTSAAYLLFYRRRSAAPLGGPKFQEIIDRYDRQGQDTSDSDSGEGQRLGHGSSPRGSSSALQTGAGATLRSGRGGSDSVLAAAGDSSDDAGMLPDYGAALADDDAEGIPGMLSWQSANTEDEGIDMRDWNQEPVGGRAARRSSGNLSDAVRTGWDFANLPGASGGGLARSEADEGMGGDLDDAGDNDSTTAQNDDSSSSLIDDMVDEEEDGSFAPPVENGMYLRDLSGGVEPMLQDHDDRVLLPPYAELGPRMTGVVVTAEQIADEVVQAEHVDQAVGESQVTEIRLDENDEDEKGNGAIPSVEEARRDVAA